MEKSTKQITPQVDKYNLNIVTKRNVNGNTNPGTGKKTIPNPPGGKPNKKNN